MILLKITGLAEGPGSPQDGKYIVNYDPDWHRLDGTYDGGHLLVTSEPAEAKDFGDAVEALDYWKAIPNCACHRVRADGKFNRPLTAYTVEVVSL